VTVLAAIRPDSWNFPLLLHVLGAAVLVGALVTAVAAQFLGWRARDNAEVATFSRLSFRALLFIAFPAWWVMRISAQWIYSKEGWDEVESEPGWIGVGFITSEAGGVLLLVAIILAGIGVRRGRRAEGGGRTLARIATVLTTLILVAFLVAVWAMTAKPN
jgi:uncharacterized membrane protein